VHRGLIALRTALVGVIVAILILTATAVHATDPGDRSKEGPSYLDYTITVTAHVKSGPLLLYGVDTVYARLLARFYPNGEVAGSVYILDIYPSFVMGTSLGSYIQSGILSRAVELVGATLRAPPGSSPAWSKIHSRSSVIYVLATRAGQEVYKCNAIGWAATTSAPPSTIEAYTGPQGGLPFKIVGRIEYDGINEAFTATLDLAYNLNPPCGYPAVTARLKEALAGAVVAIVIAAVIAYMTRPRVERILSMLVPRTPGWLPTAPRRLKPLNSQEHAHHPAIESIHVG